MQYNNKDYKPKLHDRWRALTVKNPYATQLVTAAYEDNGIVYGEKCIEVRSKHWGWLNCTTLSPSPSLPRKIGRIPAYRPKNVNPLQRGSVG